MAARVAMIIKPGVSSSSSAGEAGNTMGQRGNHCEECMKESAKWYCVADEAYLCERCDAVVHSSNCVAKRHKRIRVDDMNTVEGAETSTTTSSSTTTTTTTTTVNTNTSSSAPASRKRPRTSWGRPHSNYSTLSLRLLPPLAAVKQETTSDFYLYPDVLPSFLADMDLPLHDMPRFLSMADDTTFLPPPSVDCCKSSSPSPSETLSGFSPVSTTSTLDFTCDDEVKCFGIAEDFTVDDLLTGCFHELHRDLHLILGETKADTSFDMDFMDSPTSNNNSNNNTNITIVTNYSNNNLTTINNNSKNIDMVLNSVKVEVEGYASESSDLSSENLEEYTINLSDFEPDETFLTDDLPEIKLEMENDWDNCKRLRLSLNFSDVLTAWSEKDSPWLDGKRPEEVPDLQLPQVIWQADEIRSFVPSSNYGEPFVNLDLLTAMGTCAGAGKSNENRINNTSAGREARVMRYREKRRTRLFSKKIRYEVRKLNAERRPRMKGRFIKRVLGATDSS